MPSPDDYKAAFGDGARAVANAGPVPISQVTRGSEMWETFTGGNGNGLPAVTEISVQSVTAAYGCVNLIAGALANMPMEISAKQANGQRQKLFDDPALDLLNMQFSPRWSAFSAWEFLCRSRLFHGDGFAEIMRRGSQIAGLRPLHPLRVQVAPWTDGSRLAYVVTPESWEADQTRRVIDQDDMLHVAGWGFDGLRSLSPLRYALRQAGGVALATQDFSGQFFANRARPDYALSTDQRLSEEDIEKLRAMVDEKHSRASGNAGRPMLLQGGLKIEQVSMSNEDAELILTRGFQIEEICRVYGVPPWMVGRTEKNTTLPGGIATQGEMFVRYTLGSHMTAFQNEINRKIFARQGKVAEFDRFAFTSGDLETMFTAFRTAIGRAGEPGIMTQNEVRARLGLNRSDEPGADQLFTGASANAQPSV